MTDLDLPVASVLGNRRTTSDDIADALREAILTGHFSDGAELNQVALARHYGVSRVPLREALQRLAAEGLVSARAHQRAVVTGLTLERVLEVVDIRILLETYLLERAIERISDAQIAELAKICDEMDAITDRGAWLRKNREFHEGIYRCSGAVLAPQMASQLSGRIERYLHLWSDRGVQRTKEAGEEHHRILTAVAERDVRRARIELEVHIMHTREGIISLFKSERDAATEARPPQQPSRQD